MTSGQKYDRSNRRCRPGLVLGLGISLVFNSALVLAQPATELFFSEYIEGTSYNKALEIFNGTGAAKDLAAERYDIQIFYNGNLTPAATIALTGMVAASDVYVVANSRASPSILTETDQTSGSLSFNGNDVVVLRRDGLRIDVIGQIGVDPGTEWGSGLTSTADNTLQRKLSLLSGDTDGSDPFDPSLEWEGLAVDTFTGLGHHALSPWLTITRTVTNTVLVSWPGPETGWLLQATTNLGTSGSVWTEIPPPYEALGNTISFCEPVSPGNRFYRLHKP